MEPQSELLDTLADRIAQALAAPHQITPLSSGSDPLTLDQAYAIADRVRARQGRQRVGRKVGFTNRAIWPIYGVDRPVWGEVHAERLLSPDQPVPLAEYAEPRIEPEIVLGLGRAPGRDMTRAQLAECVDWVAPGFEIVQSIYPGWTFSVADSIAAQGMHGSLVLGPKTPATPEVLTGLPEVPLDLAKGSDIVESGVGANALGGPIEVLAHLVSLLPPAHALTAGELVTTGTLTDAWPVSPGDIWTGRYGGVMGTELTVRFA